MTTWKAVHTANGSIKQVRQTWPNVPFEFRDATTTDAKAFPKALGLFRVTKPAARTGGRPASRSIRGRLR